MMRLGGPDHEPPPVWLAVVIAVVIMVVIMVVTTRGTIDQPPTSPDPLSDEPQEHPCPRS